MGINYKWLNERVRIPVFKHRPVGHWLKVSEAAEYYGVTNQTIRNWYLKGKIECVDFNKFIHVKIDPNIKVSIAHQEKGKGKKNEENKA